MCRRFALLSFLILISLCFVTISVAKKAKKIKVKHGPSGMSFHDSTKCDEFAKYARFNPYSVTEIKWFVFYYWAPPRPFDIYMFTIPTANHTKHLHRVFDKNTIIPIDWSARQVLMMDHKSNTFLLIERGDRGQYWMYEIIMPKKGVKLRPRDVRLKQTGDNRLIGLMDCDSGEVFAMCRLDQVPRKKDLLEEASRLNYRGRRGKSYLYQGHEFGPVPEGDEENFWMPEKYKKFLVEQDYSQTAIREENNSQQSGEVTDPPSIEITNDTKVEESNNTKRQEPNNTETQLSNHTKTESTNTIKVKRASVDQGNHETGNSQLTREQLDTEEIHVIETVHPNEDQEASNAAIELNDPDKYGNERNKQEGPRMVELKREYRNINDEIEEETKEESKEVVKQPRIVETTNKDTVDPLESPVGAEDTAAPQPYEEIVNTTTSLEVHGESRVTDKPYLPSNYH